MSKQRCPTCPHAPHSTNCMEYVGTGWTHCWCSGTGAIVTNSPSSLQTDAVNEGGKLEAGENCACKCHDQTGLKHPAHCGYCYPTPTVGGKPEYYHNRPCICGHGAWVHSKPPGLRWVDCQVIGCVCQKYTEPSPAPVQAKPEEPVNYDPYDFVEPCEPDCTPERHAYHQGQWDMAGRMNKHFGLEPFPGAAEGELSLQRHYRTKEDTNE